MAIIIWGKFSRSSVPTRVLVYCFMLALVNTVRELVEEPPPLTAPTTSGKQTLALRYFESTRSAAAPALGSAGNLSNLRRHGSSGQRNGRPWPPTGFVLVIKTGAMAGQSGAGKRGREKALTIERGKPMGLKYVTDVCLCVRVRICIVRVFVCKRGDGC